MENLNYEKLKELEEQGKAIKIDSAYEGTNFLFKIQKNYYHILIDNTVEDTTLTEWEEFKKGEIKCL